MWNIVSRFRSVIVLAVFAATFVTLCVNSYTKLSATWDEPQHVTAGYMMYIHRDYRLDPEHPPLARMWAALPLLANTSIRIDLTEIDGISPATWAKQSQFLFAHWFLYKVNDADALLHSSRLMIVILGVLLGTLLFFWARELYGFAVACLTLAIYALEPNVLAHSQLVTTDMPHACFFFGTIYFLWRTMQQLSPVNLTMLGLFFSLAHITKYSAVLLIPITILLLVARVISCQPWDFLRTVPQKLEAAAAIVAGLFLLTWFAIWAVYGFRYLPSENPNWKYEFSDDPLYDGRAPLLTEVVDWVDSHRLLPNAYSQGFLLGQLKTHTRGSYLHGQHSDKGWWYYFPVAFAVKTPISELILILVGTITCVMGIRHKPWIPRTILIPIAVYIGVAMMTRLNIGIRHILPLYPLVVLLAAGGINKLWNYGHRLLQVIIVTIIPALAIELILVYPHCLAFFNQAVGGPTNGHRWLVDSNLDWGQDLKELQKWMVDNGVTRINLSYFGTADPAYYGIDCVPIPGAPFYEKMRKPQLPGYVAISATNLKGAYMTPAGREYYRPLRERDPVACVGYSIFVYYVDRPWWSESDPDHQGVRSPEM